MSIFDHFFGNLQTKQLKKLIMIIIGTLINTENNYLLQPLCTQKHGNKANSDLTVIVLIIDVD